MSRFQAMSMMVLFASALLTVGCGEQDQDLSGAWKVSFSAGHDPGLVLHLVHSADTVTGFMDDGHDKLRIAEGRYSKKKLSFKYEIPGEGEVEWSLEVQDKDTMKGVATTWESGHEGEQIEVTAKRAE